MIKTIISHFNNSANKKAGNPAFVAYIKLFHKSNIFYKRIHLFWILTIYWIF